MKQQGTMNMKSRPAVSAPENAPPGAPTSASAAPCEVNRAMRVYAFAHPFTALNRPTRIDHEEHEGHEVIPRRSSFAFLRALRVLRSERPSRVNLTQVALIRPLGAPATRRLLSPTITRTFSSMYLSLSLLLTLTFILTTLTSCAPPRGFEPQGLVADRELLAVSLAREGAYFYARGRMEDAERSLRQSNYLYPQAYNVTVNLALTIAELGQYEEALAIIKRLEDAGVDPEMIWGVRGRIARMMHDPKLAKQSYKRALAIAEERADTAQAANYLESLAALAFESGDDAEALCLSSQALSLNGSATTLEHHIFLLMGAEKPRQARELLEARIAASGAPPTAIATYLGALAYLGEGDLASARQWAQRATGLNPDPERKPEIDLLDAVLSTLSPDPYRSSPDKLRADREQEKVRAILEAAPEDSPRWSLFPVRWRAMLSQAKALLSVSAE